MSYSTPYSTAGRPPAQAPNGRVPAAGAATTAPKTVPPPSSSSSSTNQHMRHMPRVTLNPTSRVASVTSTFPHSANTTPPSSARALGLPTTTPPATVTDKAAVEAVNVAYEKTEAHLKAIEEKLAKMHEELRQRGSSATSHANTSTPSREAAGRTPTPPHAPPLSQLAEPHSGNVSLTGASSKNGFRRASPIPPVTANVSEFGNPAGANHHLQPIEKPTEPPVKRSESADAANKPKRVAKVQVSSRAPSPNSSPMASAKPAKASSEPPPPPASAPVSASVAAPAAAAAAPTFPSRNRFSIDESNIVATPEDSSGSSDSDSSDDEKGDVGSYLPAAAQRSFVKPTKPPPPPVAPAGPSLMSNAAARKEGAAVRQGIGFKGRVAAAGGGGGRRGIKMNADEGESAAGGAARPGSATLDAGSEKSAGESGQMFAVGRQHRRASLEASLSGGLGSAPEDRVGVDNAKAVDGLTDVTRRQSNAIKHVREHFFSPIPRFSDVLPHTEDAVFDKHDVEKLVLPGAPCSWLCCAALAISYISSIPTPVEKVLKANHMGVHYISLPTVTLAELYDVTNDYIHTRFHRNTAYNRDCAADEFEEDDEAAKFLSEEEMKELANIHCEMATFDTEVLDPEVGEEANGMGEHAPITSLAQFRKELVQHLVEEKSMYIFNYDPYTMEQAQLRLRSNMCDSDEEAAAVMQSARYVPKSVGHFGMLLNFNPVKHTATILTPYFSKDPYPLSFHDDDADDHEREEDKQYLGKFVKSRRFETAFTNLVLEEQTVSLQVLYESVNQTDPYTSLSRGFVRVFTNASFAPKVPPIFPLFVLDGSSAGGLMTSVLDVKIAPHVLGLAMVHHLSVTFLLSDNARRKQSSRNLLSKANVCDVKLRGIPLTKICQQLRLPLSMIVCESNKSSIANAYVWYHLFLQQLQINQDVRIGLVLPSRRDGAEDGQPNITDTEFLEHLQLVVKSQSVMLVSFDVNVGLNVRIDKRREPAHFAIVIGLDEARGIVRLADVNVKRFRKTWHVPISRLYNAVMGYGYMVASKDKKVIKSLNCKEYQESVLQCARYFLPPPAPPQYQRFEYPTKPYPVTVLADAVERLGFPSTNVERFLNFSGFHISYFLSHDMPLEGAGFVIENYSHYALDDAVHCTTTHYDFYEGNPPPTADESAASSGNNNKDHQAAYKMRTEEDLLRDIQFVLAEPAKRKLIVKYDVDVVASDPAVWNGSGGSSFAFVMDYEAATRMVVLSNADPSSFYRSFACPLTVLFGAVCSWDHIDLRARGTLLLTTEVTQESVYENVKGYDMAHALVHHPFKPIFSAACSCLALAATEMMMNIEAPTLLGGAPLSFEEDEKRKYKRYNNIFSAEDFLYALPSFSVHDWRTQPVDSQDVISIANNAFATLRLPLRASDVLKADDGARKDALALLRACSGTSGLLTITLVAYDTGVVHGVPGTSVGVVNRVHIVGEDEEEDDDEADHARIVVPGAPENSVGSVQLLEGDPCRWGACFECCAEELMRAIIGIYLVEEVVDEEEEES